MAVEKTMSTTLTKTSDTPAVIADLLTIGEVGGERSEIEITTLDSPDECREFVSGLKDSGEVAITGILKTESSYEAMVALFEEGDNETWEIEFASGAIYFLVGFVKSFKSSEIGIDGVRNFTGSIRLTGKIEYAASGVSA